MHTQGIQARFQSPGLPLTSERAWSRPVAAGVSFSLSASLSDQCVAYILSKHALAKASSCPPGPIKKMYPIILQDTHLAKQQVPTGTTQEGYISM